MVKLINYLSILTGAGVSLILYKTIRIYLLRRKYRHIPGPKTNGILGFYLGNIDHVLKKMSEGKVLADLMLEYANTYGSVFKYQVLDKVIVFTIHQEGVKEVLITENFPKIPEVYQNVGYPYSERYLGQGLITETDFDSWKKRRGLFNHGFHRHVLLNSVSEFNSKIDMLMEKLRSLADGKTIINLFTQINHAALDIIANVAFGMNIDSINDPKNELNHHVYESVKGFYKQTFDPFLIYKPLEWKFIFNYKRIIRSLRNIGKKQILKRLLLLKDESFDSNDILSNLLKNHVDDKFNLENMVDDFLTFFVAGQETTANTLAFCILELGRNPRVLTKLRKELDQVLGSKSYLDFEVINKLSYTNCVYKETLRLWPPIPEIARIVNKDIQINGYDVPCDSWVQVSTYASGRYENYFEKPEEFLPERFELNSETNQSSIKNYTYFPFSLGARNCIGQNFAQIVGKMFIAKFVQNFDFTLDSNQKQGAIQEATLRPADGTRCYLSPRRN